MKFKTYFLWSVAVLLAACTNPESKTTDNAGAAADTTQTEQNLPKDAAPAGFTKLGEATGDLDNDGKAEMAVVFDTGVESEIGTGREIHIFKQNYGAWELWHKSAGAIMASQSGGVMGDPFQEVKIENGNLAITHFGGSRSKWTYTHQFRYQNGAWQLVRASSNSGAPCEYFDIVDYVLTTGKVIYTRETENCDNEEEAKTTKQTKEFTVKPAALPILDDFNPGANELKLPGVEEPLYY